MSKIQQIQAVRGMNDILPSEVLAWSSVEKTIQQLMHRYGYSEIRTPILENTGLFKRSIGEVTDIVEKEMYTFVDRSGDSLSLRPEGTASCIRAAIEQHLIYHQTQKLWYYGPMFRHERPQKGRLRQFYQLGVEALGFIGPYIDAEVILLSARLWHMLGIENTVELQLNSLGTLHSRQQYREVLVTYFTTHFDALDDECKRRLSTNPLRILDSKNPSLQTLIEDAPKLIDYLDEPSRQHFEALQTILTECQIPFRINSRLVRGLDYYNDTVFEWVSSKLGAQGTVCAGGRYDTLINLLGGEPTPAVGFALGIERLLDLIAQKVDYQPPVLSLDAYIIHQGPDSALKSLKLAEQLREALPTLSITLDSGGNKFATQFKRADKLNAKIALILGEDELTHGVITVKNLRASSPQLRLTLTELIDHLSRSVCG